MVNWALAAFLAVYLLAMLCVAMIMKWMVYSTDWGSAVIWLFVLGVMVWAIHQDKANVRRSAPPNKEPDN